MIELKLYLYLLKCAKWFTSDFVMLLSIISKASQIIEAPHIYFAEEK